MEEHDLIGWKIEGVAAKREVLSRRDGKDGHGWCPGMLVVPGIVFFSQEPATCRSQPML